MTAERLAHQYEHVCESIYRDWLDGRIDRHGLWNGFSLDHCPEPYLDFQLGDNPLIYVTHNPGRGESFQLRSSVDTLEGPLRSRELYRDNARRLASWYSGAGSIKISAAARSRIAAMQDLARQLDASGVRQVETFPLHSCGADAKRLLSGDMRLSGALGDYLEVCKRYIAGQRVVIAISGSAPNIESQGIITWAEAIGLEPNRAAFLPLRTKGRSVTVGVFATSNAGRLRALFCCQGSNSLPAREQMPDVVRFLHRFA